MQVTFINSNLNQFTEGDDLKINILTDLINRFNIIYDFQLTYHNNMLQ